ncbi:MAG: ATP-binding protein [Niastella sp.]|uniref:GAF domain-containing sensor histidine kinase n=1 Tax=Niastella sp. TaxID=1869183 RepID=UPI00389A3C3E
MKADIPVNENLRLADLYQYNILDTPEEEAFDHLVKLASRICEAPISLISLIDAERQWFKARLGLNETETSRNISFCSHGILNGKIFIVPDATNDERFADNPLVTGDHKIRFYAGVPLTSEAGNNLGMLCVKDTVPRNLTIEQQEALMILGKQVVKQLELRLKNQELERITVAQRRIISIIAHDVRSPLSSIVSLFKLYQDKRIDPDRFNNFLNVSSTQLHSTIALLENLVEWGKIQLQPRSMVPVGLSLKELVDSVFTELTVQASLKENRLVNETSDSVRLDMDENMLRFMLRNLLTNANKFTEKGRITVDGFNFEKKVIIRVIDTGIGMPARMAERLFLSKEKYSRRGTQNESGSGLGLVLIREFVENSGGSIKVQSTEGQGSSFIIELPLQKQ